MSLKNVAADSFLDFGTQLILTMTRALVDHPEKISVEYTVGENTVVFRLQVGQGELGQVLGRRGSNIFLLREILKIYASKSKRRAVLEVAEPLRQSVYDSNESPIQEVA